MKKYLIIGIIVSLILLAISLIGINYYDKNYVQTMDSSLLRKNECCSCGGKGLTLDVCCSCRETNLILKIFKGWILILK